MTIYRAKQPFLFSLFGASGDLAKLKIFPALYELAVQKRMPKDYFIVGFSRTEKDVVMFREEFATAVRKKNGKYTDEAVLADLIKHVHYFTGQYADIDSFRNYREFTTRLTKTKNIMHLAYFSVPPVVYNDVVMHLAESRTSLDEDLRLIIEKPFGTSRASAEELYHFVTHYFPEEKIYLLDHFLGKSSVQSIRHLRHTNRILSTMMHGTQIANIQITAFEEVGIGDRVGYFDDIGIIKDMVQSHILQTLALVTMSIPITECAESIHRERYNILSSIVPPSKPTDIVLGQYAGYKREKGVPKTSRTETFAALKLFIDREEWYRVPIYLRTGKKTTEKHTFVVIELKKFDFQDPQEEPNRLIIELQPSARITMRLLNRLGESGKYQELMTSDSIACDIDGCLGDHADLILSAIREDKTNFLSFPEIIRTWQITDAILAVAKKHAIKIETYKDGTDGPATQHHLTKHDGFRWFDMH